MAFLPAEITRLKALSDEMVTLIQNKDTSNEGAVAYSRIGKVCTRAIATDAAQAAKRTTRADNVTKFQTARQNRTAAKKGGTPPPQASEASQPTSSRQRTS